MLEAQQFAQPHVALFGRFILNQQARRELSLLWDQLVVGFDFVRNIFRPCNSLNAHHFLDLVAHRLAIFEEKSQVVSDPDAAAVLERQHAGTPVGPIELIVRDVLDFGNVNRFHGPIPFRFAPGSLWETRRTDRRAPAPESGEWAAARSPGEIEWRRADSPLRRPSLRKPASARKPSCRPASREERTLFASPKFRRDRSTGPPSLPSCPGSAASNRVNESRYSAPSDGTARGKRHSRVWNGN